MKKQKGIKSIFLHQFVAENFIDCYSYSKPHIRKLKKINSKKSHIENNDNNDNNLKITSSEAKENGNRYKFNIINVKNDKKNNYFVIKK